MSTNYGFEPTLDGLNNIDSDSSTTTNIICDTITVNTSSTVPTRTAGDSTTNIANTAFVTNAISTAGGSYVTLAGASQTISSEKIFSNANTFITGNTVTDSIQSSAVGTTQNIATTQTSGILNIATSASRTGAVNIATGATSTAQVNISSATTLNAPITIGSSSSTTQKCSMNAETTFNKNVNIKDSVTWRFGISSGLALSMAGANTFTWDLLDTLDTCYFRDYVGGSIMYFGTTGIITGKPIVFGEAATFNNDILIQQSTYPSTDTSQLGYNKTETLTEFTFAADTLGTIGSFTVPSKGVWICNISVKYRTTGGAGSFENNQLFLTNSASGTTAYRTFEYFDETDIVVGTNGKRFVHTISGTLNTTASTTFYIRGLNDTTGITTLAEATYTYTRVG